MGQIWRSRGGGFGALLDGFGDLYFIYYCLDPLMLHLGCGKFSDFVYFRVDLWEGTRKRVHFGRFWDPNVEFSRGQGTVYAAFFTEPF